ncbi:MAG TPA: peptidoglycan-associated lipoprotein Pal [Fluviicoccus sp.]|nr:peptidoglycan-associated lipoprotein Pal [Fluviicoccus sp.]
MPPSKLSLLAVCLAATLATGCASTAKKPVAVTDPPAASGQATDNPSGSTPEGAQTGALNGSGGLNSQGMDGGDAASNSKSGTAGGAAGSGADSGSGNNSGGNADNGGSAAASLSDRVVNFDFDSADIQQDDYPTLLAHARYLQQNPQAKVTLEGHADERGTREYNMALGERRAKAVEAFLGVNGARGNQLESVSFGKEKPLNDGHDEAAWAENRRVELNYEAGAPKP